MRRPQQVRPDPALVRLMMGFYDAVLSMQLRHWLSEPDGPGPDRRQSGPAIDISDVPPLDDWDDGGAGARVPRRPRVGPFHPPAAVALDEPQPSDMDAETIAALLAALENPIGDPARSHGGDRQRPTI